MSRLFVLTYMLFFSVFHGVSQETIPLLDVVKFEKVIDLGILRDYRFNKSYVQVFSFPYLCYISKTTGDLVVLNVETNKLLKYTIKSKGWITLFENDNKIYVENKESIRKNHLIELNISDTGLLEVSTSKVNALQYYFKEKGVEKLGYCNVREKNPESYIKVNETTLDVRFEHPILTMVQPTNYIDFTSERTLFCQASTYHVDFFDDVLKKKSTIKFVGSEYFNPNKGELEDIQNKYRPGYPSEIMQDIQNYSLSYDLIWGAYFLSKNSVFVVRTRGSENTESKNMEFRFDIWSYSRRNWQSKYFNIQSIHPSDDAIIGEDCLPFTLFEYGTHFFIQKGKLYVLKQDIPEDSFGVSKKQYKEELEEYYSKNSAYYKLYVYRFKE